MKLSIYLMRDSVTSFDDILTDKAFEGKTPFKQLPPGVALPFPCRAYIQVNKSGAPKWEPFLRGAFKTRGLNLTNQTNSFLLLIEKQNRFFAVTLGFGFTAIDPSVIETRFGLMVAANWLTKVNGVETSVIDRVGSNKKLHVGESSDFAELALNPQIDFIKRMEGKLPTNKVATKISGCDSCCISFKGDIPSLGAACTDLLDYYESKDYKKLYGFLDNLMPISRHDPRRKTLDKRLLKRLKARSYEKISVAFPEMPDEEKLHFYKVTCRVSVEMEELGLEGIYRFMDEYGVPPDPANIRIRGIGDNDVPVTPQRTLRDYLAAEFKRGDETFIFCNGDWFVADADYVKKVRADVAAIEDLTADLALPPVKNKESEGDYNDRAAAANGLLKMDKQNFRIGGSYDKVEVCDLMSESVELICVKKMASSSTMSHLFSQGSVSATLLRKEPTYRDRLSADGKGEWPSFGEIDDTNISDVKIVYAVATRKAEPLSDGMFFFSLVNLLNNVDTIRMTGCKVALCKIDYEAGPAAPKRARRKKRSKKTDKVTLKKPTKKAKKKGGGAKTGA